MTTLVNKTSCATKPDGANCQARALPGPEFCFFHDPSKAEERRKAQGGRQNRIKTHEATSAEVEVEDCGDAIALPLREEWADNAALCLGGGMRQPKKLVRSVFQDVWADEFAKTELNCPCQSSNWREKVRIKRAFERTE